MHIIRAHNFRIHLEVEFGVSGRQTLSETSNSSTASTDLPIPRRAAA